MFGPAHERRRPAGSAEWLAGGRLCLWPGAPLLRYPLPDRARRSFAFGPLGSSGSRPCGPLAGRCPLLLKSLLIVKPFQSVTLARSYQPWHTFSYAVRVELTWLSWRSRLRLDCQEQTAWHTLRHSLAHRDSSQLPASSACGYILPAPARKITEKKMRTLNPAESPEQKGNCKRKTPAVIREISSARFYILYHGTRPERTEGPAACSDRKSSRFPLFGLNALIPLRFQACAPSPGSPAGIFAGGRRRAWKTED